MITHGNKQISEIVYARKASEGGGAVRLTNIIRGAQVVFGWLYPDVKNWLEKATKAAILAAFGQDDGYAVLGATNAYLNGIAATDPTKASALAGFINEDPMLVCSLVDTGKTRWLVNSAYGNYIVTPFLPDYGITYGATVIQHSAEAGKEYSVFGSRTTQTSSFLLQTMDGKWRSQCFGGWTTYGTAKLNVAYNVEFNFKGIKVDDTQIVSGNYNPSPAITDSIWLVVNNNANAPHGSYFIGGYAEFYRKDESGEITNRLVPFQRDNKVGMLDIVSCTFYPNANTSGSFTIEYTIPDGTPWTPLNQTP